MIDNYKLALKHEWEVLKSRNLKEVAKRRGGYYNQEENQFEIEFLNNTYVLDFEKETIKRKSDDYIHSSETNTIILNYLGYTEIDEKKSPQWITAKEIPNGGAMFFPAFYRNTILRLKSRFGYDLESFEKSCINLGAKPYNLGDKGFLFEVFPRVSICVGIWEGDDEIDPGVNMLFNRYIENFMHVEISIGLGMYIGNIILNGDIKGFLQTQKT